MQFTKLLLAKYITFEEVNIIVNTLILKLNKMAYTFKYTPSCY